MRRFRRNSIAVSFSTSWRKYRTAGCPMPTRSPIRPRNVRPTWTIWCSASTSASLSCRRRSMHANSHNANHYDYAVIRVVPRVEREEFVNVGVILSCEASRYLEARIELDEARVLALAPSLDLESLRRHLDTMPAICRGGAGTGPIGLLPQRARFHWLTAKRSSI